MSLLSVFKPLILKRASTSVQSTVFTRGKRTATGVNVAAKQRLISLFGLVTRTRKQPRRLKLSYEDQLKHATIHRAFQLHRRQVRESRQVELEKQYAAIKDANDELLKISPELFAQSKTREVSVRFPLEYRIPTHTPPKIAWDHSWTAPQK
ncbi:mitochondrial ribosomal protein L28-domain-containing protein [Lipomyces japonicus]|uniref:mitochondrial 54S ribosomal protein mL40 n=1 Tax=Lipomyces japonicus TaxID=56871 RepID=UPI0034CE711B